MTASEIVSLYSHRWQIEPIFHNLKRWWGINNLWQKNRAVLERWMQIRCIGWSMVQLLAETLAVDFPMAAVAPWRIATPVTAGLMAQWLHLQFLRVPFWKGFDPKSGKFQCPTSAFWADTDDHPVKRPPDLLLLRIYCAISPPTGADEEGCMSKLQYKILPFILWHVDQILCLVVNHPRPANANDRVAAEAVIRSETS
ncbi:MAG: transposase [Gammaproteobacteria bacterium]|nr:transposase [Gammaproteobacteria bacterium]